MKVVIPGGSGQVGGILARHFQRRADEVTVLSRHPQQQPWRVIGWDQAAAALEGSDVCLNLAGKTVNCRYGPANRREIRESRVRSTLALHEVIAGLAHPPRVWINASTATIYRHAMDRAMDEATGELGGGERGAPNTWRFSIEVAKAWEAAFFSRAAPGVRQVAIRSAMTMSPDRGGVFDVLLGLVRHGLGGRQGSGKQYVSWVHEADFVRAVDWIIARADFTGVVNLASPCPLPNAEFIRALRDAWRIGFGLAIPRWAVEVGAWARRTESELILKSRRVVPGRLLASGFRFRFPEWPAAAEGLVARWREAAA